MSRLARQWLWFAGLWAGGVATVGVVALILRLILKGVGAY